MGIDIGRLLKERDAADRCRTTLLAAVEFTQPVNDLFQQIARNLSRRPCQKRQKFLAIVAQHNFAHKRSQHLEQGLAQLAAIDPRAVRQFEFLRLASGENQSQLRVVGIGHPAGELHLAVRGGDGEVDIGVAEGRGLQQGGLHFGGQGDVGLGRVHAALCLGGQNGGG